MWSLRSYSMSDAVAEWLLVLHIRTTGRDAQITYKRTCLRFRFGLEKGSQRSVIARRAAPSQKAAYVLLFGLLINMHWSVPLLLVLSTFICGSLQVDKACEAEIGEYYRCLDSLNRKSRTPVKKVTNFGEDVDACFVENKCVSPARRSSLQDTLMTMIKPCMDELEKNANVVQEKCLAKHNPVASTVAKHVFVGTGDNADSSFELDEILFDRTRQTYKLKALEALNNLHELDNNETICSSAGREKVKNCLVNVFGAVAKSEEQPNLFLHEVELEEKYNAYCADRRSCFNKLSKKCFIQLNENKDSFCHCMQYHFQSRLLKDFQKCSGATTVSLATSFICEVLPNEESCRRSYLEAKLNIFDFEPELGMEPPLRRKRNIQRAKLRRPIALRFYH
ncbi:unnamed protein product [Soboliphyme baturini]|uniref:DUF19 domain-containing protein n=1 Tax=Soboliphyme baturini TaxID=241478 RepID=A0A183IQJ0_9BILA|nr:unnamed protein product [Soboliphyme baturini]